MPIPIGGVTSQIASAVGPAIGVGIAVIVALASSVFLFRGLLMRVVGDLEDRKTLRDNADKFGFAGHHFGEAFDAQEYVEKANEDFEAEERREANEQGWFDHYAQEAMDRGMTYEDAVEDTRRNERRISDAMSYVRDGCSAHEAIFRVNMSEREYEEGEGRYL